MAKLPSSGAVEQVAPPSDPGLSIAPGAFESRLGIIASEISEPLQRAGLAMQSRRDAVEYARAVKESTEQSTEALRKANAEGDLSRDDDSAALGDALSQIRQQAVDNFPGSGGARARLEARLTGIESAFIGQGAAAGAAIARDNVDISLNEGIAPILEQMKLSALQLGTQGHTMADLVIDIDRANLAADDDMRDHLGGLDPLEERARRDARSRRISRVPIVALIKRGDVEAADALLQEERIVSSLPQSDLDAFRTQIADVKFARDKFKRLFAQVEAVEGPLSADRRKEIIDAELGIKPEGFTEVGDPDVPGGSKFVRDSELEGQPGRPRKPLIEQIIAGPLKSGQATRPTPEGGIEVFNLPGGDAERKEKPNARRLVDKQRSVARKARVVVRDLDKSIQLIKKSKGLAAGPIAGGIVAALAPFSPGARLARFLTGIRARITFDTLQDIRDLSKTGGALGQVSDKEAILLGSALGNLDIQQKDEVLLQVLGDIRELYLDAWFGTPEEHEAAIAEGRLTEDQVKDLVKRRTTVGFDEIGRELLPAAEQEQAEVDQSTKGEEEERLTTKDVDPEVIMTFSLDELRTLDLQSLDAKERAAFKARVEELKGL